jgi:hypothetical protein
MSTQPESKVSTAIMKKWRALGAFCYKVHGGEFQMAGVPDISGVVFGASIWCETKMPGNWEPSLKQKIRINQIRRAGGHVVVAYGVSDAVQMIEHLSTRDDICAPGDCLYTSAVDPAVDWHPLILEGKAR